MARRTKAEDPIATMPGEDLASDGRDDTQSEQTNSSISSGAGAVVDSAKQAASQVKEAASNVIGQAKDQATSRVDQQRQTVASGFQAVAQAFRTMGDDLRNQEQGPVAQYAAEMGKAMSEQVERLANYLHGRDVHQLVSDVEDLARRSPTVFLGSAFVLGLAASRFLKSSRPAPGSPANMPNPSRALLPPASTPIAATGSTEPYESPVSTSASPAAQPAIVDPGNAAAVTTGVQSSSEFAGGGNVGPTGGI